MATINELMDRAKKNTKHIENLNPEEPSKAMVLHRIEDSPTSAFTVEGVETATQQSISRLMNFWKNQISHAEENLPSPDIYIENANKIFSGYQSIRFKIDSTIAFLIGDILNECKNRFFDDDKKNGKKWLDFLKAHIHFSLRQAYDFMSISKKLSFFRDKDLTMEQFRALLSLHSSGFEIHTISEVEGLSPARILEIGKNFKVAHKTQKASSRKQQLAALVPVALKLERMLHDFYKNTTETSVYESEYEKTLISSLKLKFESFLHLVNKDNFNS